VPAGNFLSGLMGDGGVVADVTERVTAAGFEFGNGVGVGLLAGGEHVRPALLAL
jgi:hypothetical protein